MTDITRRNLLWSSLCAAVAPQFLWPEDAEAKGRKKKPVTKTPQKTSHVHRDYTALSVPNVGYQELVREHPLECSLADRATVTGRLQRAVRWRNITLAVEGRYGIPRDYLLGMISVESEGDPTQPNALGDGGLGLIHMQPLKASEYGLDLITDSRKLRDFAQGRKIEQIIEETNGNLKKLIAHDDRFHPIKNIDAAGRMLADFYERTHSWQRALEKYAGRSTYDSKVIGYAQKAGSRVFMKGVRNDFLKRNTGVKDSKGKQLTFDAYIEIFHNLNMLCCINNV